ncbi:putative Tetratricopeptide repeat (TPR)-like superfamily protein [Tripterygium wilfordii]|uniref:Putative Tetratricopeptide repeat (TPR)-like superfamily protein n=1 Tax=Tripterygium wilfordii TaxID=458696 RepID=A0A7J7BXI3_TRIWF|nr:putative pentatricopeptide repeat-containing protein At3g25060, mitochondrial [Tripterygium wilfordii]KAF5726582.1 putative Tetratricopeptide repeat (TPR)-like superfamily protein [Tripterygium wilfordii]
MHSLLWPKHFKSILLACKDRRSISRVHALVILTGLTAHKNCLAHLIASYEGIDDITSARYVFDEFPQRGVDAWNAIIIAYSRKGNPYEVLGLYKRMIVEGARPDSSTFTVAIKACANLMDLRMGEEIQRQAADFGYENDDFVGSSVLNLYAKCGKMEKAMMVFDKMPEKNLVGWTTMVTGFLRSGQPCKAIDMYRKMQEERIEGDEVVMLGLIQASAQVGDIKFGLSIHGYMIRRGFHMDVVVQTSLVDMYAKNGKLGLALLVFKKIDNKTVISWSVLMSGFAQNGFAENALELIVEMQCHGFRPDSSSLVSALLACAQVGIMKFGKSIHGYIMRRFDFDQVSGTAVIDMYSKCGSLSSARAVFDRIESKDSISWNAMIESYGVHGLGKEALSLFLQMTQTNIQPDHATFASLLSAFSHSGLAEEGLQWFNLMVSEYKIQPRQKHYACMVDLLARAGRVEEAHQLIQSMNIEPGLAIWVALLSGCLSYGKSLIGNMAAAMVLELNPDDLGIYALVSNYYSMTKKWDKVAVVRKIMKEKQMKKVPGYSAVEVNGKHHAFLMEDKTHHQHEDIMQILDSMDNDMRSIKNLSTTVFILQDLPEES